MVAAVSSSGRIYWDKDQYNKICDHLEAHNPLVLQHGICCWTSQQALISAMRDVIIEENWRNFSVLPQVKATLNKCRKTRNITHEPKGYFEASVGARELGLLVDPRPELPNTVEQVMPVVQQKPVIRVTLDKLPSVIAVINITDYDIQVI